MKNLKVFEDDINNCSRCGLCQAVCPIFQLTKNDCTSPKGKFTMLNELLKNNKKTSRLLKKYMRTCLNCKKCIDFCPSKIDMLKINSIFYEDFSKCYLPSNNVLKIVLSVISLFFNLYRFLKLDKLTSVMFPIFIKLGKFGKKILLFNYLLKEEVKLKKQNKLENPKYKVLFFQGCVNKYINPSKKNALLNFMNENNVEVKLGNFTCCGRLHYLMGKKKGYEKIVAENLKIINDNNGYDYIVFDCASCFDTVSNYQNIDKSKLIMVEDFLNFIEFNMNVEKSAVYYKPCLQKEFPKIIEKNNIQKFENKKSCCGGSLPFAFYNSDLAKELSKNTAKELSKYDADCILTSCTLCKSGLYQGFLELNKDKKILSFLEFISK